MKIALYMAISLDGFIATKDGDSDWVSELDLPNFLGKIKEMGCLIVGKRTFDQYQGVLYPVRDVLNLVMTSHRPLKSSDNIIYCHSPREAIKAAETKGLDKILLIGGGTVNGMFLKENLITETYLIVHPLILGEGIKLFEKCDKKINLQLLDQKKAGRELVQLHYQVIK